MPSIEKLANGLTLIVEEIPHSESAAYELSIPGGMVLDPEDRIGACLILAELNARGAGNLDSKQLSNAFEEAGIRHAESADHDRFALRGSLLAEKLPRALELVSWIVLQPAHDPDEIESIQNVLLQELGSLVDHPAQRALVELGKRYYPAPFGRPSLGTEEGIRATTLQDLKSQWTQKFKPEGAVLSVAGKVTSAEVRKLAEQYFGEWSGKGPCLPEFGKLPPHRAFHVPFDSAQLQIALAYPSARFGDPDYYAAKVTTGLLSGGMFGRLFIEVREKRGLCYSVYARHGSTRNYGTVTVYAGTTAERAHETFEVTVKELRGLKGTVTEEELDRAKANLSAALVIGEESTASRASSNAFDWWIGGTVRTLDEIQAGIDAVTVASVDRYLERFPANSFMSLTLGSRELALS
ncbi:MAG: insulinase family protein [Oligoflexia bacterium]|nr:insulinase family protein [Oligoflexia bacterium]